MAEYKYTLDFWNFDHVANFQMIKKSLKKIDGPLIMEIGTFEGRTATWFLENLPASFVVIINPNPGPQFHNNMDDWLSTGRLHWIENYSYNAFLGMGTGSAFDFIYIDGDHNACGVLEDAVLAWRFLKPGGILLFDDFGMKITDPWFYVSHREFKTYKGLMWIHPREAINAFLSIYKGQYEVIIDNYQVGLKKICSLNVLDLDHGDKNLQTTLKQAEQNG